MEDVDGNDNEHWKMGTLSKIFKHCTPEDMFNVDKIDLFLQCL